MDIYKMLFQKYINGETGIDRFTISVSRDILPDEKFAMLEKIIAGKASLLKKTIGTDTLTVKISEKKISFPWFPYTQDSDEIRAYTELVTKLCEMASRQKRTGTVKETLIKSSHYAANMVLSNQFHTEYHRVTLSHTKKSDSMGLFNGRKLKNSETALF